MIKKSILEQEYKTPVITEETIKNIIGHPRFFRGHARTTMGRLYTNEEFKKRSNEILAKEMP